MSGNTNLSARRFRGEHGFTLVELMLATVIMGIIVVPLTAGIIVGLRTTEQTRVRLKGSNDAQLLSVWFPPDVQSTGNQSGDVATTSNSECSGVSNVLRLQWRETQGSTTTTYRVAYATRTATSGGYELVRYACTNSGSASTHVVARNLASASAVTISTSGTRISMTVTGAAAQNDTGYTFTVSGNRRTT